jgi:hypothetical protein
MRAVRLLFVVIAIASATAALLVLITGSASVDLGTLWHSVAPESLNLTQAVTQRYLHPALWTHGILPLLLMPAAAVFITTAVVAMLLLAATLRRKRRR